MATIREFLSTFSDDEKSIFFSFRGFPNYFSVDWFSEFPISTLIAVISEIEKQQWLSPQPGKRGHYLWTSKFPQQEWSAQISPEEMSRLHRNSVDRLSKILPKDDDIRLALAKQCILAGLQEDDLAIITDAALIEENKNRISDAIHLYDTILSFIEQLVIRDDDLSETTWNIFIDSIERRASLSLLHPTLRKAKHFLKIALEHACKRNNQKTRAYIELLIGQNYWMHFQHNRAIEHFNRGLEIINTLDDRELYKRALKIQGLILAAKGHYFEAIKRYENSLGELESPENNDFFLVAALNLSLCYTEVGMPQRGLGISESIQKKCSRNDNLPLLAFAHTTAGIIFLHIRNLKESRSNFEKAAELAKSAQLPMMEALAGIGLANVCYFEDDKDRAAEHFKSLWKISESDWYCFLNFSPLLEVFFALRPKFINDGIEHFFDVLRTINPEEVDPFVYSATQRLLLLSSENESPLQDKINTLLALEEMIEAMGESIEASLIRAELARLFMVERDMPKAQEYALKSWKFLNYKAKACFPLDLFHLLPKDCKESENTILELVMTMGRALGYQENPEETLVNMISLIAQIGGAEKTGLFVKEKNSSNLRLIASRNLFQEDVEDESFHESMELIKSAANNADSLQFLHYEFVGKKRILLSPIMLSRKIIGVLYKEGRFLNVDIDMEDDNEKYIPILNSQIALSIQHLLATAEIMQLNKKLLSENLYYLETMDEIRPFRDIVGTSKGIMEVQALIRKVAPTQSTVLVHGETGVGKELVARAIHRESPRKDGPFIRVNCAALPDTLIDSELFGHEKGAFTGATHTKAGRFELANNGTIFLDEISELPPSTQARLLRILQEKEFQRVGGTKTLSSNFRLVAATNKDLSDAVEKGNFRADLYYRLNVFPINVPPLRERIADIPLLVDHFVKFHCTQNSKEYLGISNADMENFKAYSWPGNIRELSNTIELAVIMGGAKLTFPKFKQYDDRVKPSLNEKFNLKDGERARILEALEKSGGKIGGNDGAAALVGLNRTTLIHRMKKLGIKIENRQTISIQKSA